MSGWSIEDARRARREGSWARANQPAKIRVHGVRVNQAATGAPAITGTPRTGQTLTAGTSGIDDDNGLGEVDFMYRWLRVDGGTGTRVGPDSSTYTVVPADVGKRLRVLVHFTDDDGYDEARASALVTVENTPATGAPAITGTARIGQTLSADTTGIADADGLSNVDYSYRWNRVDGSTETRVGTDSQTYTVVPADVGKRIRVGVTFTDDGGTGESVTSDDVTVENTPATGALAVSGTGRIGGTLSAETSAIADPDGLADVSYRYRWIRVDGTTETPIPGAYADTYTLVTADLGKRVRVVARFTDDAGNAEAFRSPLVTIRAMGAPAVCAALPDLPAETHAAVWTGTVTVGAVSIENADTVYGHGFAEPSSGAGVRLEAGGELSDREFAVGGRAYTVRTGLVAGGALLFQVDRALTDAEVATLALHVCGETYAFSEASYDESVGGTPGYTWAAGLDWSGAMSRTLHLSRTNAPATGAPGISGAGRVGGTLEATTDGISDSDGLSNVRYSYQWFRVDGATETPIEGATARSYTPSADDEGKRMKVEVDFTDDLGFAETLASAATAVVRAADVPATCAASEIPANHADVWTGEVTVGALLFQGTPIAHGFAEAVSPVPAAGALSDKDLELGFGGGTAAYTVQSSMVSAGGGLVFGLDRGLRDGDVARLVLHVCGEAYAFSDALYDPGARRYTWSAAGLDWSSVTSRTLRLSQAKGPKNLGSGNTVLPSGTGVVLVFSDSLDHSNLPSTSAFTVTVDGIPVTVTGIEGHRNIRIFASLVVSPPIFPRQTVTVSYRDPTPGDDAKALQDGAGNDVASFENVAVANLSEYVGIDTSSGHPAIAGTARVDETLSASPGDIDDPDGLTLAVYAWQWIRVDGSDERDIAGATAETYTLVAADRGKRIRVRASFVDDAGSPETRTSERTGTVGLSATAPTITIAPDRPKATGRFDYIHYTLAREGPAADAVTVTVTLEPPAGNDWEIDDDKIEHEVRFRAGEATAALSIRLTGEGIHEIGFAVRATTSGTLGARLGAVTGYDTADTAEVEVVVVPDPLWIARLTEPAYVYIEDGIQRRVTLEVSAAHPEMPAPSPSLGRDLIEVSFSTDAGTAVAFLEDLTLADFHPVSLMVPVPASTFSAGPDGVQRGRAIAFFTPRQDSEPEETETLWFVIERAPIIPIGEMHLERPDGRRGTEGARYPMTIVEANTPATGAAGISGSGRAGETLRATTDAITDADGLADATYRYRWIRIDGDAETEVGTDSAVYMPVAGDIGKRIRVEVSLTDDLGFAEGPFASAAVAIHAAMPPAVCPAPGPAGAGRSALASVGVEVGAIRFVGTPVAYGYFKGDTVLSAGGAITGASVAIGGTGYTVEGAWAGTAGSLVLNLDAAVSAAERAALVLHVCGESYAFADAEHHSATDAYTWRHAGLDWSGVAERTLSLSTTRSLPTGAPGIEGTGRIGETLAATTDGIEDADGRSNADFAYEWIRVDAGVETDIAGATAATYTVTADDVHKGVRVRVRFTDDRSFAEAATSAVLAIVNTPATGAPELSGAARAGATVRARMGTVADADGLGNADYSYRWLLIDGTQESEVGTDSSSYGLAAADEGKRIRVEVTFTDDLGTREGPLASAPAAILDGSPPLSNSCGAPGLAGREQIWSSRVTLALVGGGVGFHVSQSGTHIQDPDFEIGSAPAYSIRGGKVFRGGSRQGGMQFELDRALTASHAAALVLHDCDEPFAFADAVHDASARTYTWPAAGAEWRGSPFQRTLYLSVPGNNPASGAPAVSGTARVGATLSALTHGIGDVDGRAGAHFSYQWVRVEGATETEISGATGQTYELTADDADKRVGVQVSFTDDLGTAEGPLASPAFPATGTVAAAVAPGTPTGIWSANLAVKDLAQDGLGCINSAGSNGCANSAVLSEDEFTLDRSGTTLTRRVASIRLLGSGTLRIGFSGGFSDDEVAALAFKVGATTLNFSDGTDTSNDSLFVWTDPGLSWSAGDTVALAIIEMATETTPPSHAGPSHVVAGGDRLVLVFSEALDQATLPVTSAFTVEADGSPVAVTAYDDPPSADERLGLALAARIHRGRTVTVRYDDPGAGDDARAVQDAAGNDAASFTAELRNDSAYTGVPDRPTGLAATANGKMRIDLAWRAPADIGDSDIAGYRIEWSPDGVAGWRVLVADSAGTAQTHADTGPAPGTTRHYRVSAINGQGTGAASETAAATTVSDLPKISGAARVGAPLSVETADIEDPDGVDPMSATFAYRWLRIDGAAETPIPGASSETYELSDADAGRRVRVEVGFTDDGGNPETRTSAAFPAHGTVIANTPATGAPEISGSGRVGERLLSLRGDIADADGLDAAVITRQQWFRIDGTEAPVLVAENTAFYSPVAADAGKRIRVEVAFTDDVGFAEGPLVSAAVAIRAMSPPATCPAPELRDKRRIWSATATLRDIETGNSQPPLGRGYSAGTSGLRSAGSLSDRTFEIGANGYTVDAVFAASSGRLVLYLDRALAQAEVAALELAVCGETWAFADAAHTDGGVTYEWPTAGLDWSEVSSRSLVLSVPDEGAAGVPTGLAARAVGGTKIALSWTAPGDPDIAGYRIEWSADGASGWRDLVANTGDEGTAYDDTGLAPQTTRHYRVSAINGRGPGSPSEAAHARTGAPDAPQGLTATKIGATQIDLAWQAPAAPGGSDITGYRIEWSADGASNWQELVANTGNTATRNSDTGLASQTTRHYRVSARNDHGAGSPSNVAHATTDDIEGPVLERAETSATGLTITLVFDEFVAQESEGLAPKSAFTVTADGIEIEIGSVVARGGDGMRLIGLSPTIKRDQAVVVTYTDPRGEDDPAAIQDPVGNDAASFTTGEGRRPGGRECLDRGPGGARRADRARGDGGRRHGDRPRLERAGLQRRGGHHGLQDRVVGGRQRRELGRPRREPRHDRGRRGRRRDRDDVRRHRPRRGRHPPLPGLGDQRGRHGRGLRVRQRDDVVGRAGRADRAHGDGERRQADRSRLDRAGGHRRSQGRHRLPDRVVARRHLGLAGPGLERRQHEHLGHRAGLRDHPPLPGLREKRRRHRPALERRACHHRRHRGAGAGGWGHQLFRPHHHDNL